MAFFARATPIIFTVVLGVLLVVVWAVRKGNLNSPNSGPNALLDELASVVIGKPMKVNNRYLYHFFEHQWADEILGDVQGAEKQALVDNLAFQLWKIEKRPRLVAAIAASLVAVATTIAINLAHVPDNDPWVYVFTYIVPFFFITVPLVLYLFYIRNDKYYDSVAEVLDPVYELASLKKRLEAAELRLRRASENASAAEVRTIIDVVDEEMTSIIRPEATADRLEGLDVVGERARQELDKANKQIRRLQPETRQLLRDQLDGTHEQVEVDAREHNERRARAKASASDVRAALNSQIAATNPDIVDKARMQASAMRKQLVALGNTDSATDQFQETSLKAEEELAAAEELQQRLYEATTLVADTREEAHESIGRMAEERAALELHRRRLLAIHGELAQKASAAVKAELMASGEASLVQEQAVEIGHKLAQAVVQSKAATAGAKELEVTAGGAAVGLDCEEDLKGLDLDDIGHMDIAELDSWMAQLDVCIAKVKEHGAQTIGLMDNKAGRAAVAAPLRKRLTALKKKKARIVAATRLLQE